MSTNSSTNFNTRWAELTLEVLLAHQINYFCISPGSRSTPLTLAASAHPQARCVVIHDERGAAFHALGYARATGRAAALICTSGTAVANYYPAVIEAAQDLVPLLVLSADRPPELRDCGANQTIDQQHIYGGYVREFVEMPVPGPRYSPRYVVSQLEKALFQLKAAAPGPVHINFPFAEPLTPAPAQDTLSFDKEVQKLKLPQTRYAVTDTNTAPFLAPEQGMLLLGRMSPFTETAPILQMADRLGWPVLADPLSGCRREGFVNAYDLLLRQPHIRQQWLNQPVDMILHLGLGFVSKALLQFLDAYLAQHPECHYVQVNQSLRPQDPNYRVQQHFVERPDAFARRVESQSHEVVSLSETRTFFQNQQHQAEIHLQQQLKELPLSELTAINLCLEHLRDLPVFVGNSMAIRDVDLLLNHATAVRGSRGTSGIDGNISMVAGMVQGHIGPCAMICGDLTLYHDLNALGTLNTLDHGVVVIVLNNRGGGIFSFLPVAHPRGGVGDPERVDRYFGTPHSWDFSHAAPLFGLHYATPRSLSELKSQLQQALARARKGDSTLIEVHSNRDRNYREHQQIYAMPPSPA